MKDESYGNQRIELVCFDLGGVLIRVRESWERTLELAGVADPTEVVARANRTTLSELMIAHETGRLGTDRFFEHTAAVLGLRPAHTQRAMDLWLDRPYEGFDLLLDRLGAAGLATACLSNTSAYHWELMTGRSHASLPLDRLTYRFASQQLGLLKPDPRIYALVEETTGVAPERIAYYDDRWVNIEGALRRGWQALQVDPVGDPLAAITADLQARGLLDLGPNQ